MPSPAKKSDVPAPKSAAKPSEAPAKPAAAKPPVAAKPATAKPSPAERTKMIAEAAYYLAQKRGFGGGNELADWATAEKQVDALIAKRG
jgi:hypothetical protein